MTVFQDEKKEAAGPSSPESSSNSSDSAIRKISLRDVQQATPSESLEETRIMEVLEQSDPTRSKSMRSNIDQITGSIPGDMLKESISSRKKESMESQGIEATLFAATNEIQNIHLETSMGREESGKDDAPPPATIFRSRKGVTTQTDEFAANAGKIFHRFNKNIKTKTVGDIEMGNQKLRKYAKKNKHDYLDGMREFKAVVSANKNYTWMYIRNTMAFVIIPATLIAALLFYIFDNPEVSGELEVFLNATSAPAPNTAGIQGYEDRIGLHGTYSWWILFLAVRQVITFAMARAVQFLVCTYALRIGSRGFFGPLVRLLVLQARGWPFQLVSWASLDFLMLFGYSPFAAHWMFYQNGIGLFNAQNTADDFLKSTRYRAGLIFMIATGVAVAFKRFYIGLRFGKSSYFRYAEKLATLLKKIALVTRVARLAHDRDVAILEVSEIKELQTWTEKDAGDASDADGGVPLDEHEDAKSAFREVFANRNEHHTLSESQEVRLKELLGDWEDAALEATDELEDPDLGSIVQFRASVSVLDSNYPFSQNFGFAEKRIQVIDRSQRLYTKLLRLQQKVDEKHSDGSHGMLRFSTVALSALEDSSGSYTNAALNMKDVKDLVKLFRPTREGDISVVDFCKSIDQLYKEIRMLRASIASEGRMNAATESFLNVIFYVILGMIGLAVIGIDPIALFSFIGSIILGVSFMISGASSDFFRGLLFILVQRPYDIGDRIAIGGPENDASPSGSSGWVVKDVTLYHTTVIFGTTQEYATYANGTLAQSRVINAARSPRATLFFVMRFGIDVSSEKVNKFKEELVEFVKARPREWLAFSGFRMDRVEADLGFVEYRIILQHRESWQQIGALLNSRAEVQSFAFDLSKSLGMGYQSPSLPVEMKMMSGNLPSGFMGS